MLTKQNLLLLLVAVSITTPALAKVYKWKDAQGVTHYTATPPPTTAKVKSKEIKIHKKPKSSLTHMNVVRVPVEEETSNKRSRVKRKATNKKKRMRQPKKVAKKCVKPSSREVENALKDWGKYGKAAVASGRETKQGYKEGMTFLRDTMESGCK